MALLGKKDRADDGESAASAKGVSTRLRALEERRFSGAIEIGVKGTNAQAAVYFHEGGIYAAHVEGYEPVLMDRLLTEGVLDRPRWSELAVVFGAHRSDPRIGPFVVEQDWMTVDELVNLHQEYLVASLGAIVAVPRARIERETSATTGAFCSLPQDVARLMRLVQGRQQRTANAWDAMEATCEPGELVLRRSTSLVPSNLDRDEFRSIVDRVDGQRSLDEIAGSLALTRTEATRTASLLVLAGTLSVDREQRAVPPSDQLLVPEAWGVWLEPRVDLGDGQEAIRIAAEDARASASAGAWPPSVITPPREDALIDVVRTADTPFEADLADEEAADAAGSHPVSGADPWPADQPTIGQAAVAEESVAEESVAEESVAEESAAEEWDAQALDVEMPLEIGPGVVGSSERPWSIPVTQPADRDPWDAVNGKAAADENFDDAAHSDDAAHPDDADAVDSEHPDHAEVSPDVDDADVSGDTVSVASGSTEPMGIAPTAIGDGRLAAEDLRRLQEITTQALHLEHLLAEAIAAEQEALARSAVIRQHLRDTLAQVAQLTGSAGANREETGS